MSKTTKYILLWASILGIVYVYLFPLASNGYGYMGYNGYHRGPSWWYWDDVATYYERSNRSGSVSGPSARGGGPGSGK